jgi:predicted lipid-binding transport protein (Tim44 family)
MSSTHIPFPGTKDASAIDLAGRRSSRAWRRLAVTTCQQAPSRPEAPGATGDMGRIIGTILGAILAIWLAFMAAGGIFATLKTFLIIGLIAMAVFIVVWLVARRPRRG